MEPITFRMRPSSNSFIYLSVFALAVMALYQLYRLSGEVLELLASPEDNSKLLTLLGITTVVSIAILVPLGVYIYSKLPKHSGPEHDFLQIDNTGLNFMRYGESRFWAWNEISAFKLVSVYRRIEFILPGVDAKAAKRDPWMHETTPDGPMVVIQDIYDASLDKILATLNAHREWAAGDGPKSVEP